MPFSLSLCRAVAYKQKAKLFFNRGHELIDSLSDHSTEIQPKSNTGGNPTCDTLGNCAHEKGACWSCVGPARTGTTLNVLRLQSGSSLRPRCSLLFADPHSVA